MTQSASHQHCEPRGQYLIEATARPAGAGLWHPQLRLMRMRAPGLFGGCQGFYGLKPAFDSAKAAIRYASELGKSLIDQRSALIRI